jgi:sugar fermentation stimulation protein A
MFLLNLKDAFEVEILERLNRFVVLVKKENRILKAHNTNTGRLKEFLIRRKRAFCLPKIGGKTDCRLVAVEDPFGFALIDTNLQMKAFEVAYRKGLIPWLNPSEWKLEKRNALLGENSYIDYLFRNLKTNQPLYLEVKSAAMRSPDNFAMYPDCPTERGRKHLRELIEHKNQSGILFIAALPKVKGFKPYCEGDPEICKLLKVAKKEGLPIRAFSLHFEPKSKAVFLENPNLEVLIS